MDSSTTSSSSISARPFNEYAFINLCATGQVDNLRSLLEAEKRYSYDIVQCSRYRVELDNAQALSPDVKSSSSNADWRYRISRWMLRASDEFSGISRETAMVALSFCDRYLMHKKINRKLFQVVAISCLYYASKLLEKKAIPIAALMNYTQGKFDRSEVLSIEKELVSTLARFSYPPSASTFCLIFLSGFPSSAVTTSSTSLPLLADTSQFMIELASCDFFFVAHKQSKIALSAIIVTLEQLQIDTSSELIQSWLTKIKAVVGGDNDLSTTDNLELMACTKQLRNVYNHNDSRIKALDSNDKDNTKQATEEQRKDERSPHRVSPTPEDDDHPSAVPKEVTTAAPSSDHQFTSISDRVKMKAHPNDNDCIDGGNPKRQRYSM